MELNVKVRVRVSVGNAVGGTSMLSRGQSSIAKYYRALPMKYGVTDLVVAGGVQCDRPVSLR